MEEPTEEGTDSGSGGVFIGGGHRHYFGGGSDPGHPTHIRLRKKPRGKRHPGSSGHPRKPRAPKGPRHPGASHKGSGHKGTPHHHIGAHHYPKGSGAFTPQGKPIRGMKSRKWLHHQQVPIGGRTRMHQHHPRGPKVGGRHLTHGHSAGHHIPAPPKELVEDIHYFGVNSPPPHFPVPPAPHIGAIRSPQ